MTNAILTQARLKELVSYHPETGLFTWIKSPIGGPKRLGAVAGSSLQNGYCRIKLAGSTYLQHRLAWLYMYGYLPTIDIDHINGCPGDNSISNLRLATRAQNTFNTTKRYTNTSGFKGVSWRERNKKWIAQIQVNSVTKYLGIFQKIEDAATAYNNAAKELHGSFYTERVS